MQTEFHANYHSHTKRCGHAVGEDEEYVLAAKANGFNILGFSDHVMLPGIEEPGLRGNFSERAGYLASVKSLKKKYAGDMTIYLGFECEWYGDVFADYYRSLFKEQGVDYLILGQHNSIADGKLTFYTNLGSVDAGIKAYAKDIVAGIRSGLFTYVCHPDLYVLYFRTWDEEAEKAAWEICRAAKEMDIPLEVNMGPSRWDKKTNPTDPSIMAYPYPKFWEIAKKVGNRVIVGVDAHSPRDYYDSDYDWVISFCRHFDLPVQKEVTFRVPE